MVVALLGACAALVVAVGLAVSRPASGGGVGPHSPPVREEVGAADTEAARSASPAARGEAAGEPRTVPVAEHDGVELVVPSAYALLVGFHESGSAAALPLRILAPIAGDHTSRRVEGEHAPGSDEPVTVIVLPSRGRGGAAASAMDVVVPVDRPIVSPVDGTVTAVEEYRLYGRHHDVRVTVAPAAGDGVEVVLYHIADPTVSPGDEIQAGETVIARSARRLPVASQIDRYTRRSVREEAPPHVHVEVRRS